MNLKSFTLPALAMIAIASANACQKRNMQSDIGASGLVACKAYNSDAVTYDNPVRMFTETGEVTDPAVIAAYRALHPWLDDTSIAVQMTPSIFSSQSELVYYNGWVPYKAKQGSNDVIIMRQQDTGMYEQGNPQGSIDFLFSAERDFLMMRDALLEMRESITKLERVDARNYRVRECFHLQGSFRNNVIRLPYTFMASRYLFKNYPFAVKAGVIPKVPAGDTLLVREGYVDMK